MAPITRSNKGVLFPVFCTVKIDSTMLNNLLREAYDSYTGSSELCVITSSPVKNFTQGSHPPIESFEPPFNIPVEQVKEVSEIRQKSINTTFLTSIQDNNSLCTKCFVVLDTITNDSGTCLLVHNDGGAQPRFLNVRAIFSGVLNFLDVMQSGEQPVVDLRNDAALSGGVLRYQLLQDLRANSASIDVKDFPQHGDWDSKSQMQFGTDLPWKAVFCTTEIPVNVLDEFLSQAYGHRWGPEGQPPPRMWIVDSITHDPSSPSVPPLKEAPTLLKQISSATPHQLNAIVRSIFPEKSAGARYPKLDWNKFIVLDEIAVKEKAALLVCNTMKEVGYTDGLALIRTGFDEALRTLIAVENTSGNFDTLQQGMGVHGRPM